MRLHRLELTAFGPFAGTERVDFDEVGASGLFLLHGPTGAGKTTLLDAVCFALFGHVPGARGAARQRLRSDHAPGDREPSVRLELTVSGRRLEIVRSPEWQRPKRRGTGTTKAQASTTVRELVNGDWVALTSRNDEAGHLLQQLVGMGVEQFTKVVLLPQGEFAAFLRSNAETRREVLSRLFEIDRYTGVESWLADERRRLFRQVEDADRRTDELVSRAVEAAAGLREVALADPATPDALVEGSVGDDAVGHAGADADRKPVLVVADLLERADVATRAGEVHLVRCEERVTSNRHAASAAAALTDLQGRRRTAQKALAELDTQRETLETDRRRLIAARRALPLGPLLAARRDAAASWCSAASVVTRAVTMPSLRTWLTAVAELPENLPVTAGLAQHEILTAHAQLLRLLPDVAACDERRSALEAQRGALRDALARLDVREALADEVARLSTAVATTQQQRDVAATAMAAARHQQEQTAAHLELLRADLPDVPSREASVDRARTVRGHAEEHAKVLRQLERAEVTCRQAIDRDQAARDRLLDVRERRLVGIASELAQALRSGDPCPVCGSADHPAPALVGEQHVGRAAEQEAAREAEVARAERNAATSALATLQSRSAELGALTGGLDVSRAADAVLAAEESLRQSQQAHDRQREVAETHAAALADVDRCIAEVSSLVQEQGRQEARLAEARGRLRSVDDELQSLLARALVEQELTCSDEPFDPRAVQDDLVARADAIDDELDAVLAVRQARTQLETAFADLDGVLRRLGITADECGVDDVDAAAGALLSSEALEALAASVESRDRRRVELLAEVDRPELVEAASQPEPDLVAIEAALVHAEAELRRATAEHAVCQRSAAALRRHHAELSAHELAAADLRDRYDRLDELSHCVDGTGGGNGRRMRLSAYVLAARLEQVAAAATERLDVMTGGRYALVHSDEVAKGGVRSGLALRVVDSWTGVERDTATLSGGESFLASLALALGLADVVQAEAGGTSIETLFVDEGFGTLDDETLDEVMTVLDGLRDGGRTVGVVSHVAELRQRIPSRIEVEKRRDGSRLVVHDACA
ncbi:MAG TPA: SMC family ATPase [Actinomycetales bacterium]|nr:SMC family ATPase [Actinomycetales bacterium]